MMTDVTIAESDWDDSIFIWHNNDKTARVYRRGRRWYVQECLADMLKVFADNLWPDRHTDPVTNPRPKKYGTREAAVTAAVSWIGEKTDQTKEVTP